MRRQGEPPELIRWQLCGTSKTWSFVPQPRTCIDLFRLSYSGGSDSVLDWLAASTMLPGYFASMLWFPLPEIVTPLSVAVALEVAAALQNFTTPGVTAFAPAFTATVSVTALGQATEPEERLTVVVVADCAQHSAAANISKEKNERAFDISLSFEGLPQNSQSEIRSALSITQPRKNFPLSVFLSHSISEVRAHTLQ